jgi:hypothetical protein
MDGEDFSKIKAIKAIKGERLPTGQALSKPDINQLFATTNGTTHATTHHAHAP